MKLSLLKYRTNALLRRNKTSRTNASYKHAQTIGIIFSVEDKMKHDAVKELVKKLEADGKKVKVMEFLPQNRDNYEFLYDFFTEKDLSFLGKLNSTNALAFADTPFDFLYYIDNEPNPYVLHLLARSKAKCRVGKFWDDGQSFFELMIESVSGTRSLIDGMYKYTSVLK